jgi:hypothetical protein
MSHLGIGNWPITIFHQPVESNSDPRQSGGVIAENNSSKTFLALTRDKEHPFPSSFRATLVFKQSPRRPHHAGNP